MNKKISVCMATYNGERFIKQQIDSILLQLDAEDELIISDDGSTDQTVHIIKSYDDERIKFFQNTLEKGYTKNFENALNKATGDIFFLSDQDDVWMENKVMICKKFLNNYDFVISDGYITDQNLIKLNETHFQKYNVKKGFWYNTLKTRYVGAFMAFNKDVYNLILPFPAKQKFSPHDYWITLIAEHNFKVKLIEQPLVLYRRHGTNVTGETSQRSIIQKLSQRIYTLINLFRRTKRFKYEQK
ncbi:glycosyltransferase family 2 protein [Enterococcus casseliflavus]|uniref:glycosyltransferase family 2 protein n=1 Tax=Enterococcus casseliflavus TaxID=37734 RepID=UPI0035DBF24C